MIKARKRKLILAATFILSSQSWAGTQGPGGRRDARPSAPPAPAYHPPPPSAQAPAPERRAPPAIAAPGPARMEAPAYRPPPPFVAQAPTHVERLPIIIKQAPPEPKPVQVQVSRPAPPAPVAPQVHAPDAPVKMNHSGSIAPSNPTAMAPVAPFTPPRAPKRWNGPVQYISHAHDAERVQQVRVKSVMLVNQNIHVREFAARNARTYRTTYQMQIFERQQRYQNVARWNVMRERYRPLENRGFYAFGWGFRPAVGFYDDFSNPCVAWFYSDYDANYYGAWYGSQYVNYNLNRSYNRVGIYFPTEEFINLNLLISDLPMEIQANYRMGMIYVGNMLSRMLGAELGRNEVVINHTQILPDYQGVVVEGFVDNQYAQFAFKALLNLNDAGQDIFFASFGGSPDDVQMQNLMDLNAQVQAMGGEVDQPIN